MNSKKIILEKELNSLSKKSTLLKEIKDSISNEIHLLNNELEYIDLGFTSPLFDYDTSETFKKEIIKVKDEQKKLVKMGLAYEAPKKMMFDGSLSKGKERLKKDINIESRIKKSFSTINDLNLVLTIQIKYNYLDL